MAYLYYGGLQSDFVRWINNEASNNIILSEKIEYVSLFAFVLSIDCIIVGILWYLYIFQHKSFNGSFFKYLTFSIDFLFDMFFASFPFLLVGTNNVNFMNAAASFNNNSLIIFMATFIPIIYVEMKLRRMLYILTKLTRNDLKSALSISNIKLDFSQPSTSDTVNTASTPTVDGLNHDKQGIEMNIMAVSQENIDSESILTEMDVNHVMQVKSNDDHDVTNAANATMTHNTTPVNVKVSCYNLCCYGKKYLDIKDAESNNNNNTNDNNIDSNLRIIEICRKSWTFVFATFSVVTGLFIGITMTIFTTARISVCDNYDYSSGSMDNLTQFNHEFAYLYVWNHCEYKVYPLADEIPCQCRNIVITSQDTEFLYNQLNGNSSQMTMIFESALAHYYMVETIYLDGGSLIYVNELNLTDTQTVSHNLKILFLKNLRFSQVSNHLGYNWNEMEMLDIQHITLSSTNGSLDASTWNLDKVSSLKWFAVYDTIIDLGSLDFICSSKSIRYISMGGGLSIVDSNYFRLPECISQLNELQWLETPFIGYFDMKLLLLPKLNTFVAYGMSMNASIIEKQLEEINANNDINELWNNVESIILYFQHSVVCYEYQQEDINSFNSNYPLTYQLINSINACYPVCNDYIRQAFCTNYNWHDGVCHDTCNVNQCGYDGGDCTQLCDFTICNYTSLGDGICNPECRNKECSFDYCDCLDSINIYNYDYNNISDYDLLLEHEQCAAVNATLCDIKTECLVFSNNNYNVSSISQSWIDDGICDDNCNNGYCNYDNGECESCDSSLCKDFWTYFDYAANSQTQDYKLSQSETCHQWWNIINNLFNFAQKNCTQFFQTNDLNGDLYLNAYESITSFYVALNGVQSQNKALQINCSLCAPTVDVYYG